jgi:hypothetical protein
MQPPLPQVLNPKQSATIYSIAHDVANRLVEPEVAAILAKRAQAQTSYPRSVHWQPYAVSQGNAGLAIMFGYLDACFPNEGWDVAGHGQLELAAGAAEGATQLPLGLFTGLSGLGFAAWSLSRMGTRYQQLLGTLESTLVPGVRAETNQFLRQRAGLSVHQYDLISGLCGVGAYLLCRHDKPAMAMALTRVLSCLIDMADEKGGVPGWYTPAHLLDEGVRGQFPSGYLNCGLAHGIPGPLALLSLSHHAGVRLAGLREAIDTFACWLIDHCLYDAWGVNWPIAVPAAWPNGQAGGDTNDAPSPSRAAWCYGSPGVARTLWLAGEALDNRQYREVALAAMEAVYRRPIMERRIDSPGFCHGVAGLLQITLRFAQDTQLPVFVDAARALTEQLVALYEPGAVLGYRQLELGGRQVDQPGLLDGAPGVIIPLLAVATRMDPFWDRLFLLT